jgi:roadblock/LC7 domain-containing protein
MIDALIPILKPLAPTLGGLLGTMVGGAVGGPAGGAVGGRVGGALADAVLGQIGDALGVDPDPKVIADRIRTDPAAADRLRDLDREAGPAMLQAWSAAVQAQAQAATEVNVTMRAELAAGSAAQRYWRPAVGYVAAGGSALVIVCGMASIVTGAATEFVAVMGALGIVFTGLFAATGIAGWGRSWEKVAMIAPEMPKGVVEAIRGARK